jgi:hypothetical protein
MLVNEPIISSTTNDNDDMDILPFERIESRVTSESTVGEQY